MANAGMLTESTPNFIRAQKSISAIDAFYCKLVCALLLLLVLGPLFRA